MFAALRMREADLEKHLRSADEKKDEAREKAREDARKQARGADWPSRNEPPKPLPEFGTAEDFQLTQALNQLKGKAGDRQQDGGRAQGRSRRRRNESASSRSPSKAR